MSDLWRIDDAGEQDLAYVYSTWLNSYQESGYGASLPPRVYFDTQHRTIEKLFAAGARVWVARGVTDPRWLAGWLCAARDEGRYVLHYAYVRRAFKRMGVATELAEHSARALGVTFEGATYTHRRRPGHEILDRKGFTHRGAQWR
jgi:GNAT superfamily N-acetyltransferase